MRVMSFKMDEELAEIIENYAAARGISKSELIRRAVREYIASRRGNDRPYITRRVKVF